MIKYFTLLKIIKCKKQKIYFLKLDNYKFNPKMVILNIIKEKEFIITII